MKTKLALVLLVGLASAVPVPTPADEILPRGEVQESAAAAAAAPRAAPSVPVENLIHSITVTPTTPNTVAFGADVTVHASYKANAPTGVLIFFRPMTGAKLTPNYTADGSPLYSTGSGTAEGSFTIESGTGKPKVTKIRCQMWNANQTELLYEVFIPVNFKIR